MQTFQSFQCYQNEIIRRNLKHAPVSAKKLSQYLKILTQFAEKKIAAALPSKFALIFDGRSHVTTHYVGIFAAFLASNVLGYGTELLEITPWEDEVTLGVDEHVRLIEFVLSVFGKSRNKLVALVRDNVSNNMDIYASMNVGFVGHARHRFKLVVKEILSQHCTIIRKVHVLIPKLRNVIPGAKLRTFIDKVMILNNVTRWSSTYEMFRRYMEIREFVADMDLPEVTFILPSNADNAIIENIISKLADVDSVEKLLPSDTAALAEVCALFDAVIYEHSETVTRLGKDARIFKTAAFENELVKIQEMSHGSLTAQKIFHCTFEGLPKELEDAASLSFSKIALKRRKFNS